MTMANQITIARILLIPFFVLLAVYYGQSVRAGTPEVWLRYGAILVFLVAAASDGLDGWLARRLNQRSRLGAILDPIADKGLLITALITLSLSGWHYEFPLWFPVLVIARDAVILVGAAVLHYLHGTFEVHPTLTGKAATAAQMLAIAWVMLQLPHSVYSVVLAGLLTLTSGVGYVFTGIRLLQTPAPPPPQS